MKHPVESDLQKDFVDAVYTCFPTEYQFNYLTKKNDIRSYFYLQCKCSLPKQRTEKLLQKENQNHQKVCDRAVFFVI